MLLTFSCLFRYVCNCFLWAITCHRFCCTAFKHRRHLLEAPLRRWTCQGTLADICTSLYSMFFMINLLDFQIKKALRGVKVEVTHRGNMRRKYRIAGLTSQETRELTYGHSIHVSSWTPAFTLSLSGSFVQRKKIPKRKLMPFATVFLLIKVAQWSQLYSIFKRPMALPSSTPACPVCRLATSSTQITFQWR